MKLYRKKPVIVEALQWTGNEEEMKAFCPIAVFNHICLTSNPVQHQIDMIIPTLEGNHFATPGCFIIKGVNGEFYPCQEDIFYKTYEEVSQDG